MIEWVMPRPWYGNPQINTRLPREQFRAIRAEASRRGIPVSFILQELVADWYRRGTDDASETAPDTASSPNPATPNTGTRQRPIAALPTLVELLKRGGQQAQARAVAPTLTPLAIPSRASSQPPLRSDENAGAHSRHSPGFSDM